MRYGSRLLPKQTLVTWHHFFYMTVSPAVLVPSFVYLARNRFWADGEVEFPGFDWLADVSWGYPDNTWRFWQRIISANQSSPFSQPNNWLATLYQMLWIPNYAPQYSKAWSTLIRHNSRADGKMLSSRTEHGHHPNETREYVAFKQQWANASFDTHKNMTDTIDQGWVEMKYRKRDFAF
eukprot:NODE_6287_length_647_cov_11.550000_g6264_i0.p1 GENE.NODE_6287_length_647_cov_11.550000_g6264_i0~~NODE_6287_length_647_cov_11.550000_g6264_i0.p1  ORF type:complete len:179 (+),score=39.09 NODE_6287_length_647_cov_11.550000_g6264_i0:73-609(+)